MAWSWSHTAEAYENLRQNIAQQPHSWLEVVFAEWEAKTGDDDMDEKKYDMALVKAKGLATDVLAAYIYEQSEKQALCGSGGYEAHTCPFGCLPHLLPFDPIDEEDDDFTDDWADES